jgi:hypothetical protein
VPWASAIIALGAFVCAAQTAWQTNLSRQWEVLDRAYSRIVDLEEKFLNASASGTTSGAAFAWRASFLNALEYLAFLVNTRHIRDPQLKEYLEKPVLVWYDTIFLKYAQSDDVRDPDMYRELKRWVAFIQTAER